MKAIAFLLFFLITLTPAIAQTAPDTTSAPAFTIDARQIGTDSVIIPYNDRYVLSVAGCATMLRHGHYNFKANHFYGEFKDVSIADTTKVLCQGTYAVDGTKNGDFILSYPNGILEAKGHYTDDKYDGNWAFYYANGNLMAKGAFKMNKYIGRWEWYYEDGRPFSVFETQDGVTKLLYQWGPDGTAFVTNGNGTFKPLNFYHWQGNLVNGSPDGMWTGAIIFDADTISTSEFFQKTKFVKGFVRGANVNNKYEDRSRMDITPPLPTQSRRLPTRFIINPFCNIDPQEVIRLKIFGKENFYQMKTDRWGEVSFQLIIK